MDFQIQTISSLKQFCPIDLPGSNFSKIPTEVLMQIFAFLDPNCLWSVMNVNTRWNLASNDDGIWKEVAKRLKYRLIKDREITWKEHCKQSLNVSFERAKNGSIKSIIAFATNNDPVNCPYFHEAVFRWTFRNDHDRLSKLCFDYLVTRISTDDAPSSGSMIEIAVKLLCMFNEKLLKSFDEKKRLVVGEFIRNMGNRAFHPYNEKCYKLAANLGFVRSYLDLGILYREQSHTEKDFKRAYDAFINASRAGVMEAFLHLGHMFYQGEWVKQNHGIAYLYYQIAANKGLAESFCCLSIMAFHGQGTGKDFGKAISLAKAAKIRRLDLAYLLLAEIHWDAEDFTHINLRKATKYAREADRRKVPGAQSLLSRIEDLNRRVALEDYAWECRRFPYPSGYSW